MLESICEGIIPRILPDNVVWGHQRCIFSSGFKFFYFSQILFEMCNPQPLFLCAWKFSLYFQWVLGELWFVWQVVGLGSDRSRRLKQLSSSARSRPVVGWGRGSSLPPALARRVRADLCGASVLCLLDAHPERLPALCIFSSAEGSGVAHPGAVGGQKAGG